MTVGRCRMFACLRCWILKTNTILYMFLARLMLLCLWLLWVDVINTFAMAFFFHTFFMVLIHLLLSRNSLKIFGGGGVHI